MHIHPVDGLERLAVRLVARGSLKGREGGVRLKARAERATRGAHLDDREGADGADQVDDGPCGAAGQGQGVGHLRNIHHHCGRERSGSRSAARVIYLGTTST